MELTLFVDHACNLRCRYCYTGEKFRRPMTAEVMRAAVDLALARRPRELDVSFFGGEPLLRWQLLRDTVAYVEAHASELAADKPSLRYLVNTNAILVDDRRMGVFAPPRQTTAFVSLDGPAAIHDARRVDARGRPSHAAVVRGIDRLKALRIPVHLVAVVEPATARSLGDTLRELLAQGVARATLSPNFRAEWTTAAIADLRSGLEDVARVWREALRAGNHVVVDPLATKILTHLHGGVPCPTRCQLGGHELSVAPSGRIYPCAQMIGQDDRLELSIGEVQVGVDCARAEQLQQQKDRVELTCIGCAIRDRCQSHCGCRHLALTGRLGEISQALCEVEAAFIDAADALAAELVRERCPAFMNLFYRTNWRPADGDQLIHLRRKH